MASMGDALTSPPYLNVFWSVVMVAILVVGIASLVDQMIDILIRRKKVQGGNRRLR
jgi:hypothetical protein